MILPASERRIRRARPSVRRFRMILLLIIVCAVGGTIAWKNYERKLNIERAEQQLSDKTTRATFPEGLTVSAFGKILEQKEIVDRDAWNAFVTTPSAWPKQWDKEYEMISIARSKETLEGFLFPDTYNLPKHSDSATVAQVMLDNFARRTAGLLGRDEKSNYTVITLASILEKEVQTAQDMAMVADIFNRRIADGQRLQSDATLRYVKQDVRPRLTAAELDSNSPYNSYKHGGLPPTPIGNPGLKAIQAALQPTPNEYWFFLTDSDGVVHYASSFDEHIRLKNKYLR